MSVNQPIIVGLGELLWDLLPTGKRLGGAPANFAHHANQLGFSGWVCSAIGKDSLADPLRASLDELGLRGCIERVELPTGTVNVKVDESGQPEYVIHENVAWDQIPFTDAVQDLASKTAAVSFGSLAQRDLISRHTIARFLDSTPSECLKVFDVNLRQHYWDTETLSQSAKRANLLKLNEQEWPVFVDRFDLPETIEAAADLLLQKFDLQWILLTEGAAGSRLFSNNGHWAVDAVSVQVIDTVGAGDAFTAALVTDLLMGLSPADALVHAARVAAFVCSQSGATPLLPNELLSSSAA